MMSDLTALENRLTGRIILEPYDSLGLGTMVASVRESSVAVGSFEVRGVAVPD